MTWRFSTRASIHSSSAILAPARHSLPEPSRTRLALRPSASSSCPSVQCRRTSYCDSRPRKDPSSLSLGPFSFRMNKVASTAVSATLTREAGRGYAGSCSVAGASIAVLGRGVTPKPLLGYWTKHVGTAIRDPLQDRSRRVWVRSDDEQTRHWILRALRSLDRIHELTRRRSAQRIPKQAQPSVLSDRRLAGA